MEVSPFLVKGEVYTPHMYGHPPYSVGEREYGLAGAVWSMGKWVLFVAIICMLVVIFSAILMTCGKRDPLELFLSATATTILATRFLLYVFQNLGVHIFCIRACPFVSEGFLDLAVSWVLLQTITFVDRKGIIID